MVAIIETTKSIPQVLMQTGKWTDVSEMHGYPAVSRFAYQHEAGNVQSQLVEEETGIDMAADVYIRGFHNTNSIHREYVEAVCQSIFARVSTIVSPFRSKRVIYGLRCQYTLYLPSGLRRCIPIEEQAEFCATLLDQLARPCWFMIQPIAEYISGLTTLNEFALATEECMIASTNQETVQ